MKALVVSGRDGARAWVRAALGPAWTVREAPSGIEALRRAQTGEFDVVIADETTEPYGAFGLTRELKLLPEPPAVIVLLERSQDTWLAKWSGADRWLMRPADPFDVAAAAHELASLRGTRNEALDAEPAAASPPAE